jgi:hypothetical protein
MDFFLQGTVCILVLNNNKFFIIRAVLLKIPMPEMELATQVVSVKTKAEPQVAIVLLGES